MVQSIFRYIGPDGTALTEFADIIVVKRADADGILAALKAGLDRIGVKEKDLIAKCIACNFDGASVNQGCKNGVVVKLEALVNHVLVSHLVCITQTRTSSP